MEDFEKMINGDDDMDVRRQFNRFRFVTLGVAGAVIVILLAMLAGV